MPAKQAIARSLLINGTCLRCIRRTTAPRRRAVRLLSTTSLRRDGIAAQEIDFDKLPPPDPTKARIIPTSPSYFTTFPEYTDDLVHLEYLSKKFSAVPSLTPAAAPRVTWKTLGQYRTQVRELVSPSKYNKVVRALQQLNRIHPALMPPEVKRQIEIHRRAIDPLANKAAPGEIDEFGRAQAQGRRKSSRATVFLVEGEGEVLINGKNLAEAFGRIHDRESAIWALKATGRTDKYNIWATVHGGGTTGQAESITLAVAKALMVHEPALKPALRRGEDSTIFLLVMLLT